MLNPAEKTNIIKVDLKKSAGRGICGCVLWACKLYGSTIHPCQSSFQLLP